MSDEQGFERVIKRLEDQVAEQAQEIDQLRAKLQTVTDIAERQSAMLGAWMANISDADAAMKADTKVLQIEFSRLVDKIEPPTHDEARELLEEAKEAIDDAHPLVIVWGSHYGQAYLGGHDTVHAEHKRIADKLQAWLARYHQYKESKA